jgi:hypothetical protein
MNYKDIENFSHAVKSISRSEFLDFAQDIPKSGGREYWDQYYTEFIDRTIHFIRGHDYGEHFLELIERKVEDENKTDVIDKVGVLKKIYDQSDRSSLERGEMARRLEKLGVELLPELTEAIKDANVKEEVLNELDTKYLE